MDDIRVWLARATAPLHRRVDRAASQFDLASEAGAAALLDFMAVGCGPVERALDRFGAERLIAEWPARRRAHTLAARGGAEPDLYSDAEAWGALYVLEGSRLGGRLFRRAPRLAAHPFFADADERGFWPSFLARLGAADSALGDRPGMAAGAAAAFAAFLSGTADEDDGGVPIPAGAPARRPARDRHRSSGRR